MAISYMLYVVDKMHWDVEKIRMLTFLFCSVFHTVSFFRTHYTYAHYLSSNGEWNGIDILYDRQGILIGLVSGLRGVLRPEGEVNNFPE